MFEIFVFKSETAQGTAEGSIPDELYAQLRRSPGYRVEKPYPEADAILKLNRNAVPDRFKGAFHTLLIDGEGYVEFSPEGKIVAVRS